MNVWTVLSRIGCGCASGGEVVGVYLNEADAEKHVEQVTAERRSKFEAEVRDQYGQAGPPAWVTFNPDIWSDGPFDVAGEVQR
jgi:hypothetical protein